MLDPIIADVVDRQKHLEADILQTTPQLESDDLPNSRALRHDAARRLLRVRQRQALTHVLAAPPAPGETVHLLSAAKWDFWTWVPVMLDWIGHTEKLRCSTWTLNRQTAVELFELWDAGRIGSVDFLTGLYFKRRETAVYTYLVNGIRKRGGRYRAFRNHAKVLLLANPQADAYITVEGSANLTANPRWEQYAITNHRPLWEFHRSWFDEMARTIPSDPSAIPESNQSTATKSSTASGSCG